MVVVSWLLYWYLCGGAERWQKELLADVALNIELEA